MQLPLVQYSPASLNRFRFRIKSAEFLFKDRDDIFFCQNQKNSSSVENGHTQMTSLTITYSFKCHEKQVLPGTTDSIISPLSCYSNSYGNTADDSLK